MVQLVTTGGGPAVSMHWPPHGPPVEGVGIVGVHVELFLLGFVLVDPDSRLLGRGKG
jgi:hypothetical protein